MLLVKLRFAFPLTSSGFNMVRLLVNSCLFVAFLTVTSVAINAQTVVFDADFEAGAVAADTGTLTVNFATGGSNTVAVVPTATSMDTTPTPLLFGDDALLVDDATGDTNFAQINLDFTQPVLLTGGNTATFSFAAQSRRTNMDARTQFVTGFDSSGSEVFQFVLNDGSTGRQQPRFATAAGGLQNFASNPGTFFHGSDFSPASANTGTFAQYELTIGENSFGFEGINQGGVTFTDTGVSLFNAGSATDLASIVISADRTATDRISGNYYDNFLVEGIVAAAIPEPGSLLAMLVISPAVLLKRRR